MGFTDFGLDCGNGTRQVRRSLRCQRPPRGNAEGLLSRCWARIQALVRVIDCPVDYSENDRILNSELRERALAV